MFVDFKNLSVWCFSLILIKKVKLIIKRYIVSRKWTKNMVDHIILRDDRIFGIKLFIHDYLLKVYYRV